MAGDSSRRPAGALSHLRGIRRWVARAEAGATRPDGRIASPCRRPLHGGVRASARLGRASAGWFTRRGKSVTECSFAWTGWSLSYMRSRAFPPGPDFVSLSADHARQRVWGGLQPALDGATSRPSATQLRNMKTAGWSPPFSW